MSKKEMGCPCSSNGPNSAFLCCCLQGIELLRAALCGSWTWSRNMFSAFCLPSSAYCLLLAPPQPVSALRNVIRSRGPGLVRCASWVFAEVSLLHTAYYVLPTPSFTLVRLGTEKRASPRPSSTSHWESCSDRGGRDLST